MGKLYLILLIMRINICEHSEQSENTSSNTSLINVNSYTCIVFNYLKNIKDWGLFHFDNCNVWIYCSNSSFDMIYNLLFTPLYKQLIWHKSQAIGQCHGIVQLLFEKFIIKVYLKKCVVRCNEEQHCCLTDLSPILKSHITVCLHLL
jgi:hypothetical protein